MHGHPHASRAMKLRPLLSLLALAAGAFTSFNDAGTAVTCADAPFSSYPYCNASLTAVERVEIPKAPPLDQRLAAASSSARASTQRAMSPRPKKRWAMEPKKPVNRTGCSVKAKQMQSSSSSALG